MNRRQFLRASLALAALLLTPKPIRADTIVMSNKGIVCNEFYPTLGALRGRIDAGVWNWGNNFPSGFQVLFDLSHSNPTTPQFIQLVLNACPFDVACWMVGFNEPDLLGYDANWIADKTKSDMNAVLQVDSSAKFSIMNFSQVSGFHTVLSKYVWNQLKNDVNADKIIAASLHYYENDDALTPTPLTEFLQSERDKMIAKGFGHLELHLTEVGCADTTGSAYKRKKYPGKVHDVCSSMYLGKELCNVWCWYQMEQRTANQPRGLYLNNVLTEVGEGFSGV